MDWKNLLGSLSESVNHDLRLRIEYLTAENRILRQQIKGRVQLSDSERKELGEIGQQLGRKALGEIATVAQPNTIIAWGRTFADKQVDPVQPRPSVGRPRVARELEDLVVRMARENRSWGYDRIQGSLKHLGYTISDQTVGNILKRHGIPPASERKKTVTWGEFIRPHLDMFRATDFFNSEVWSGFGLMISYLRVLLHFCSRHVSLVGNGLQHPMQGLQAFGLRFCDTRAHAHHGIDRVTKRFPARRYGNAILAIPVSDLASCGAGGLPSQDAGNIRVLSSVHPRPIRDGPVHHGQSAHELLPTVYREAA